MKKHIRWVVFLLCFYLLVNLSVNSQAAPILNSTYGLNGTNENLTCYPETASNKDVFNWYRDYNSLSVLNMPFEGGSNSTWTKDYSIGNDGIVYDVAWNATGGYDGKGCYEFNGANYINVPATQVYNFTKTRGMTVMAWIRPVNLDSAGNGDLISNYYSTGDQRAWMLQIRTNVSRFFGCSDGTIGSCEYATGTVLVNDPDTWYHVVGRWNGTHIHHFLNGVVVVDFEPLADMYFTTERDIRIGRQAAVVYFNGSIDDVLIFNYSLTSEQILALYRNRTDMIISNETSVGQNWTCEITSNNGTGDIESLFSNSLIILEDSDVSSSSSSSSSTSSTSSSSSSSSFLVSTSSSELSSSSSSSSSSIIVSSSSSSSSSSAVTTTLDSSSSSSSSSSIESSSSSSSSSSIPTTTTLFPTCNRFPYPAWESGACLKLNETECNDYYQVTWNFGFFVYNPWFFNQTAYNCVWNGTNCSIDMSMECDYGQYNVTLGPTTATLCDMRITSKQPGILICTDESCSQTLCMAGDQDYFVTWKYEGLPGFTHLSGWESIYAGTIIFMTLIGMLTVLGIFIIAILWLVVGFWGSGW